MTMRFENLWNEVKELLSCKIIWWRCAFIHMVVVSSVSVGVGGRHPTVASGPNKKHEELTMAGLLVRGVSSLPGGRANTAMQAKLLGAMLWPRIRTSSFSYGLQLLLRSIRVSSACVGCRLASSVATLCYATYLQATVLRKIHESHN